MSKRRKPRKVKRRNPYAIVASLHSGSGRHPDEKKEANKAACRKPITRED